MPFKGGSASPILHHGAVTQATWEAHPPVVVAVVVALIAIASWWRPFRRDAVRGWGGLVFVGGAIGAFITSATGPAWAFGLTTLLVILSVGRVAWTAWPRRSGEDAE